MTKCLKIPKDKVDKLYFSSDFHGYHSAICEGTTQWERFKGDTVRPFPDPETMTTQLINNVNKVVPEDGILFHLGDWCWGGPENARKLRNALHVRTIYAVQGNHDDFSWEFANELFDAYHSMYELTVKGPKVRRVTLCHYSMRAWNCSHYGAYHLFGHTHAMTPPLGKSMDVGIDANKNFRPFSWQEIENILSNREAHDTIKKGTRYIY